MRRTHVWLLLAPLLLVLALLLAYPILYALKLAFTDPLTGRFPSLASFAAIGGDALFWRAAGTNLALPLASIAVELGIGLGLALFLSQRFRGRALLRLLVVVPFALPEIVVLTMMRYVFVPRGYANAALATLGLPGFDWLVPGSALAWLTIVLVDAWHVTPVVFLILLAALADVPEEIGEAARLDGASATARLWRITLPLLRPAILAALLLRGVDALRIFATPLVLTGPEGVPVLSSYAYHQWSDYGNDAAAAAAASVLAALSVVASVPLLRARSVA